VTIRVRAKSAAASVLLLSVLVSSGTLAQPASGHAENDEGVRVFKSANCVGCHKWTGSGGGGYGGAAANLRQTALTRD
jgi:mono/diheme cytochrome c family protein